MGEWIDVKERLPEDSGKYLVWLGGIEFCVAVRHPQEHGISIRASGSRLKNYAKVIDLFSQIIDLLNEEAKPQ